MSARRGTAVRRRDEGSESDCKTDDYAEVHIVDLPDREDGLYVFADLEDARRFEEAASGSGAEAVRTSEPVNDRDGTDALIRCLLGEAGNACG
jgi:hypothetical protein